MMVAAFMLSTYSYSQCACCAGAGAGAANGDYNNGILTLNKKQLVVETYTDYRKVNQNLTPDLTADETPLKSMIIQSVGMRYGLTKSITVSALVPYVFLHTDIGNDNGIGDLDLLATFSVYNKNDFSIALQAG